MNTKALKFYRFKILSTHLKNNITLLTVWSDFAEKKSHIILILKLECKNRKALI